MSKPMIRLRLFVRQNRFLLGALGVWFLAGFLVYSFWFRLGTVDALLSALYLRFHEADSSADFAFGYSMWGQALTLGVVLGLLVQNALDRQNPERGCRLMAQMMKGHTVVIGYSHLGKRLVQHFLKEGIPFVLIEKDREKIDELLRDHQPIVIDDAREPDALADANVKGAKAVIVASNNVETALLVTKRVRDLNKQCLLIVRCFHDELTEVLEALGANGVISSSKTAFEEIVKTLGLSAPTGTANPPAQVAEAGAVPGSTLL